jgi:hypothetical protein
MVWCDSACRKNVARFNISFPSFTYLFSISFPNTICWASDNWKNNKPKITSFKIYIPMLKSYMASGHEIDSFDRGRDNTYIISDEGLPRSC